MKRFAIGLLSSFAVLAPIAPALAASSFQPNPFQLVNLVYEGHYLEEGLPSHLVLEEYYTSGRIMPEDVVAAAVRLGELPEAKLQDSHYLNAVRLQMRLLKISNHHALN